MTQRSHVGKPLTLLLLLALEATSGGVACDSSEVSANSRAHADSSAGGSGETTSSSGGAGGHIAGDSGAGGAVGNATGGAVGNATGGAGGGGLGGGAGGSLGCGTSEWPTYGHDTQRTSASDGCMNGPLTFAWSYFPKGWLDSPINSVDNVVTAAGGVFVRFTSSYGPQMDGVSTRGQTNWTWAAPNGRDVMTHHWASFGFGVIMVADDGLFLVDAATGENKVSINEYDDWGQNTADDKRFYINSELNSPDGPGFYIGAYTSAGVSTWKQDQHKDCDGISEKHGSLVVDGGKLFRSGLYSSGGPLSGVASYDAATGTPGWMQGTTPASAISAGSGHLFLVEGSGSFALVARLQTDGTVAWSQPLAMAPISMQAPVVAGGLVIVATASEVRAFNAGTGEPAWTTSNIAASVADDSDQGAFDNCPGEAIAWASMPYTTLAAAVGSGSLVVTAKDAIHILSLADGSDQWHGTPAAVTGPLRNPVIVGHTLYAVDLGASKAGQLVALTSP